MPLYEFTCQECKKEFELLCKMEERYEQKCPQCEKPLLQGISSHRGYAIYGDNSGSTPKRGKR